MDRRSMMLAGLAVAATAKSAFAQSSPMSSMGEMGAMGDAEKTHVRDTLQVGTMSLELSRLAASRVHEAMVKQFADFEIAEQETIGAILKPLLSSPAPVDPMQAELMKKLESAGANFDRDYIQAEIQGHQKLLQIQEQYLSIGKNMAQVDIAKLARGMINEHLALLRDLEKGGMRG
jgi:putative membrane protein